MNSFFDHLDPDTADEVQRLSRLAYESREHRRQVLAAAGAADEDALLARIRRGELAEYPAYEHYLAVRILGATQAAARAAMSARLASVGGAAPDAAEDAAEGTAQGTAQGEGDAIHLELAAELAAHYGARLSAGPTLRQDALLLTLANGITVEIRYAATDAYALEWTAADERWRIDTAPVHLAYADSHLHCADGRVVADPLTRTGEAPLRNVRALLDALLDGRVIA